MGVREEGGQGKEEMCWVGGSKNAVLRTDSGYEHILVTDLMFNQANIRSFSHFMCS